jgi:DNA-binding NarL/FixJ family response regulator
MASISRALDYSRTQVQPERMSIPSIVSSLTDRQRVICLLSSVGELDKRIANLLDIGQRTVELEKRRVANSLGIPTQRLVIWAVENRRVLRAEVQNWAGVSELIRELIAPDCFSEPACEYSI